MTLKNKKNEMQGEQNTKRNKLRYKQLPMPPNVKGKLMPRVLPQKENESSWQKKQLKMRKERPLMLN